MNGILIKNNTVVNIIAVDENTDSSVIEFAKSFYEADTYIEVDDSVIVFIGGLYEQGFFYPPKPSQDWIWNHIDNVWQPPMPSIENGISFIWNPEKMEWEKDE